MKTAMSVAVTRALAERPLGHSQPRLGVSEPSGAVPFATFASAITEKITSTSTSMPSSPYCSRAETSMPR